MASACIPKCRALPVELHPDIQFLPLYHGEGENQRFFCLWSFLWSKPLLCRFRQPEKNPLSSVLQGFAAFRLTPSRIPPRHSQTSRATSCATPRLVKIFNFSVKSVSGQICGQKFFAETHGGGKARKCEKNGDFASFRRSAYEAVTRSQTTRASLRNIVAVLRPTEGQTPQEPFKFTHDILPFLARFVNLDEGVIGGKYPRLYFP